MVFFLFLFSFIWCINLSSPQKLFVVDDRVWYDVEFYEEVFKDDWAALSRQKKEAAFNDYITRELHCYFATKEGFYHAPKIKKALDLRKNLLLINNTYEHLIARPLVSNEVLKINSKNLLYKTKAYHLLIG